MQSRSGRYFAKKVYPIALATAVGAWIYLWATNPDTKKV